MSASPQPEMSKADRRKSLVAAISCIALFGVTIAVLSPLVSLSLEARGVERSTIGFMAAVPALALLATNPFIPAIVGFIGFRRYIFGCMALQLILVLLMPVFDSVPAWFVLRGLMGASVNGLFVASETWINTVAEERSRGRVMAIYGTALSGSFALGPLIITMAGSEGALPFLIIAGILAVAGLPLLWAANVAPVIEGRPSFNILTFMVLAPTLVGAVFYAAFRDMTMGAMLPIYAVRHGLSEGSAAALLTAAYLGSLCVLMPIGWLADRMNRYVLIICIVAFGMAGVLLLPVVMATNPVLIWSYMLVWAALSSGQYVVAMAIVGERFKGADLVTANAAFGFLWGIGSLTGPALTGVSMDVLGLDGFVVPLAVVSGLVLAVALFRFAQRTRGSA